MDENNYNNPNYRDNNGSPEQGYTPQPPQPKALTVEMALKDGISLGLSKFVTIFGALILWLVTIWIPYLNVGTTIAILTMPSALANGEEIAGATYIFDGKYRKYMGEYFSLIGLKSLSLIPAFLFLYIPGLVISIGWSLALYVLFDKRVSPSDALLESTELTSGHKMTIFLTFFLYGIVAVIAAFIVMAIANAIDVGLITLILWIAYIAVLMVGFIGIRTVIYKTLTELRNN